MKLTDRVFIITGGSEGIGFACGKMLLEKEAQVCLLSRSEEKLAIARANYFTYCDNRLFTIAADVSNPNEVEAAIKKTDEKFGRIDGVIHAAGVSMRRSERLEDTTVEEYKRITQINADGTFYIVKFVLPIMKRRNSGYIINISSNAAYSPGNGYGVYSASKSAVRSMTETLIR